jgi:hypothetical protein
MKVSRVFLSGLVIVGAISAAWWFFLGPDGQSLRFENASSAFSGSEFSYESYAATLMSYVDEQGMVSYKHLKANRGALDAFAASIGSLDPKVYERWNDKQKIAF